MLFLYKSMIRMKRIFSRYALNIFSLELEEWPYETHTHNFYELILVNEGCGIHHLNDTSFNFSESDIFLLTPEDHHSFELHSFTRFTYIKFTEQIFDEKPDWNGSDWLKKVERILFRPNTIPESIIADTSDREMMFVLAEKLKTEFTQPGLYSRQLMLELFGAILTLIVRHLSRRNYEDSRVTHEEKSRLSDILAFIRQHIGNPEKITQQRIASEFHLSHNYVSTYLRKHTGMGLRQMITQTRLKTAERLLRQSTLTISQIAGNLGFTDASHMNKAFRKYRGMNPSEYRK